MDEVLSAKGHAPTPDRLCRIMWNGRIPGDDEILQFLAGLEPHQVAVAVQSFIGVEPQRIRALLAEAGL